MPTTSDGKIFDEPVLKPYQQDSAARSEPIDHGHVMAGRWATIRVGSHPVWQGDAWPWKAILLVHDEFRGQTVQADIQPEELDALIALLQIARRSIAPPKHLRKRA